MSVPLRTAHDRAHVPGGWGGDRVGRWLLTSVIVLVTAVLIGAGVFLVSNRGSSSDDQTPSGDGAPAPEGDDEPGGADDPGGADEPEEADDPGGTDEPERSDPDAPRAPTILYGVEPRADWDVTGVAADDVLNVRAGPGTTFPVTGTLAADAVALASTGRIARVDGVLWRELVVPDATTGWVHASYLAEHLPDPPPQPPDPSPEPTLPASLLGAEWDRVPTSQMVVALTFDAGANADGVPSILRTLDSTGTPATFFLTGRWTDSYPEFARQIAARYPVGNHSVTHPYFTELTDEELLDEVTGAETTIEDATGNSTRPFFRFPFGDRDERTIRLVNEAGYGSIRWTVDTLGWKGTSGGMTVSAVLDRVLDTARPGQIMLLHVGSHPTDHSTLDADALPRIIEQLDAEGYRFITLREALTLAER